MKFFTKLLLATLLLTPFTALAVSSVPWSITNLTDPFIFPAKVNGNFKGIQITASSTIGNGTQGNGLNVSGGATTTGSMAILNSLVIGTSTGILGGVNTNAGNVFIYNTNMAGASPAIILGGNSGGDTDFWIGRQNNNDATNNDSLQIGAGIVPGTTPVMTWTYQGNEGIGSTSPFATLSVHANPTDAAIKTVLFAIGSSTAIATSTLFSVFNTGNALFGANAAVISATPVNVSYGGTYGNNTPGTSANLKWDMFNDGGSNRYGIGMSTGLMEFQAGAGGSHAFYVNLGTEALDVTTQSGTNGTGGLTQVVGTLATTSATVENDFQIIRKINNGNSFPEVATFALGRYQSGGGTAPFSRLDINLKAAASATLLGDTNVMTLQSNGSVGFGTTSPFSKISIHANNLETNTTLFAIGSSTATATTTFLTISNTGVTTLVSTSSYAALNVVNFNGTAGSAPYAIFSRAVGASTGSADVVIGSFGITQVRTSSGGASLNVGSGSATVVGLGLAGVAGQTANLLNVTSSASRPLFTIGANGNTGLGTSTPYGLFTIIAASTTGATAPTTLFAIASTTGGTATSTLFSVDNVGHQYTSGSTPSVSGGTSSVVGNDNNGTITVTGTLLTSVTLTFANAWSSAPDCTMADSSTGVTGAITSISSTQLVIGFSAGVNSGTVWYQCVGHI